MQRSTLLTVLVTLTVLALGATTSATPKFIHYQGYLTDGSGNPVPDDPPLSIRFAIYNALTGGDSLWGETKTVSTNNGKFHVKLGQDNDFPEDLFSSTDLWLGIKVGSDSEMDPRTPMGSVPYAFLAGTVPDTSISGKDKIKHKSIIDSLIADTTIGKDKIKHKSIIDSLIADTTIGKDKIKHKSIIDSLIADTTIGKDKIKHKSIIDSLIADTTIGKDKLRNKTIVDSLVDDTAITSIHIRNRAIHGNHIDQSGADVGQVLKWDGTTWSVADDQTGAADNDWTLTGHVLYTSDEWGIARSGNILLGIYDSTHVNLGVACTTGTGAYDSKFITISGGSGNKAEGEGSVIAGGGADAGAAYGSGPNQAASHFCVISGGSGNQAGGPNTDEATFGVIGGGRDNQTLSSFAVVSGGSDNQAGGATMEEGRWATVGGGAFNQATGLYSVVGGGGNEFGTGGNVASGEASVVAGGTNNHATHRYATVSGGINDSATGQYATVGGGMNNVAGGNFSTVPGGAGNIAAANYSFAAGYGATVNPGDDYTFVWSDWSTEGFQSSGSNQFLIHAENGVGINTNSPTEALDVDGNVRIRQMASGGGLYIVKIDDNGLLYQQSSSQRYKDHIAPLEVEARSVLRLNPVSFEWRETGAEDIGLIAEEVEQEIPELVIHDNQNRPDGVKYDLLPVYLLEVIKAQQTQIDRLAEQVESQSAMQEQLSQLRALVEVLMAERNASSGGSDELASNK